MALLTWWSRLREHWRAMRQPPPLDLAAPPLLAEVVILVARDGTRRMYVGRVETQEQVGMIAGAILSSGMDLARQHGITIRMEGMP